MLCLTVRVVRVGIEGVLVTLASFECQCQCSLTRRSVTLVLGNIITGMIMLHWHWQLQLEVAVKAVLVVLRLVPA